MAKAKALGIVTRSKDRRNPGYRKLTHKEYLVERELLARYEQAAYRGYERAILTLSAAFLAFSVSFLVLLEKTRDPPPAPPVLDSSHFLFWSWYLFAASLVLILVTFFGNAVGFRAEIAVTERRYQGETTSGENIWIRVCGSLYALSLVTFVLGVAFLLLFCQLNFRSF